ncbi:MAG: flbT [Enterovirga sp.]|jgi:flagellar protein FlbT|nr:flbT [Enterovirga sp.]
MPLKVELKPNERIIIGTAVITNGDNRTRFFIEGEAPILREKDILTPASADTPAKRIYLALQLMYLAGEVSGHHGEYFKLVNEFVAAAPSSLPLVAEINNFILNDELYKALKAAQKLIVYEGDLVAHASGRPSVREDSTGDTVATAA